jgi:hypothetical protein
MTTTAVTLCSRSTFTDLCGLGHTEEMNVQKLKNRWVVFLAVLGLFALSGIALAAGDEDTVFNYGYDQDSQFFAWNVTSLDWGPDYEALAEALGLETPYDALEELCGLQDAETAPIEYTYDFDAETGKVTVDVEGDPMDCGDFQGGYVTGPSGQVNHGMFLKLFNSIYDGPHRGCLVRHIAGSKLGKDDQKVEADPEFEAPEEIESIDDGRITFTTVGADCLKGPDIDDEDGDHHGPPDHVLEKKAEKQEKKADKWGDGGPGKSGAHRP